MNTEDKKFVQNIIKKYGKKDDIKSCLIGNGYSGKVWRISNDLCLKISNKSCYTKIPNSFQLCENLCVPLNTFVSKSGGCIGFLQKYLNLYSLDHIIKKHKKISESQTIFILHDILSGLKVIHENGYVHRDLYPGNIMLTKEKYRIKAVIIDFDEIQLMRPKTRACFRYSGYQAPEIVFDNDTYDDKSEIFAVGTILWELVFGNCPFGGYDFFGRVIENYWDNYIENPIFYNNKVKIALKSLPKSLKKIYNVSSDCKDLLNLLLNPDKNNRITAMEALKHPFFKNKCRENLY